VTATLSATLLMLCQPPAVHAYIDGEEIGSLTWNDGSVEGVDVGEIVWVEVAPMHRRCGVASAMLRKAQRATGEDIHHGNCTTAEGEAWARAAR